MRLIAVAASFLVLAATWSCGGGSGSGSPAGPSPAASGPPTITITGNAGARSFTPNPATFGGLMVTFRNNDSVVHRVRFNDGTLDTGDIMPGASSQPVRMPAGGTNYHCSIHPSMIGAVSTPGSPPPPCTGEYCG